MLEGRSGFLFLRASLILQYSSLLPGVAILFDRYEALYYCGACVACSSRSGSKRRRLEVQIHLSSLYRPVSDTYLHVRDLALH